MEEKKVTTMVLKVDLDCEKCRKKVKKVLCRTPQVQDQVWDEKKNTVTVKVLCCSPEKIKDKIRYKGGDSIQSIDIVVPKPPEKPKEAEKPKAPEKPKESDKPKAAEKPKDPEKPKAAEKPKDPEKPKAAEKPKDPEKKSKEQEKAPAQAPAPVPAPAPAPAPAPKQVQPVPGAVPVGYVQAVQAYPYPIGMSCSCPHCYGGVPGGHCCYRNDGPPAPQYYQYDGGYIGRPVYDSYGNGGGRNYGVNRGDYFSEENPQACSIM